MTNDSMFSPSEKLAAFLNDPTIEELMSSVEYDLEQAGFARPNLTQMLKVESHNYQVSNQQEDISGSLLFVQEALENAAASVKALNAAWSNIDSQATLSETAA